VRETGLASQRQQDAEDDYEAQRQQERMKCPFPERGLDPRLIANDCQQTQRGEKRRGQVSYHPL